MPTQFSVLLCSRPTRHLGVRVSPDLQDELHRLADELGCRYSSLTRLALAQGIDAIRCHLEAARP